MPRITLERPGAPPVVYRFEGATVAVGRAASNDLLVDDPLLSRRHLEFARDRSGAWRVRDLDSSNGTMLNGRALRGSARVTDGDRVAIGATTLVFSDAPPAPTRDADARAGTGGGERETARLSGAIDLGDATDGGRPTTWIGDSPASRAVLDAIERFAPGDATVLIVGESGTGKELVARRIHERSGRDGPFVAVNCPALPGSLLETELFGVERGVATGVDPREGLFETARGGTILLDEIGDLDPAGQAKLLRALQERAFLRVGGRAPVPLAARVLAATNHDLPDDVRAGAFRLDLYHRLNVLEIRLPPLRERADDVEPLARHFLGRSGAAAPELSAAALRALAAHSFPGNVRELEHVVERARRLASGREIQPSDLTLNHDRAPGAEMEATSAGELDLLYAKLSAGDASFWDAVRGPFLRRELPADSVRALVRRAWDAGGGTYKGAARVLGIERDHKKLLNFLRNHGLGVR